MTFNLTLLSFYPIRITHALTFEELSYLSDHQVSSTSVILEACHPPLINFKPSFESWFLETPTVEYRNFVG